MSLSEPIRFKFGHSRFPALQVFSLAPRDIFLAMIGSWDWFSSGFDT